MLSQETLNKLKHMKLTGMVEALRQQETDPSYREMGFQERLGLLVDWEFSKRQHSRLQRLIRSAKFQNKTSCVENISYEDDRQLDRNLILELASCNYIPHARNIIIVGPTGAGKSFCNNRQIIRDELDDTRDIYSLLIEDVLPKNKKMIKRYRRSINAIQSNLERLTAIHRSIVYMPRGSQYSKIRQNLYKYLEYLLILHRQIYIYIALNKDYQKVEKDIDTEEIRKEIVGLIKVDNDESVFEFYNVYFEATRINEKLEQLKSEFELDF
jgi:hypothetical protein